VNEEDIAVDHGFREAKGAGDDALKKARHRKNWLLHERHPPRFYLDRN
jgi:hypothetical protein